MCVVHNIVYMDIVIIHGMCVVHNIVYMGIVNNSNKIWYVLTCIA